MVWNECSATWDNNYITNNPLTSIKIKQPHVNLITDVKVSSPTIRVLLLIALIRCIKSVAH